jgi:PAS domain S-box-containing protein
LSEHGDDATELQSFRQALDQHSIVSVADATGRIVDVNDMFCEVSGYSADELLGQDHRLLNSGYHPKEFFVEMWRTLSANRTWHGTIRNRRKDGSFYWVKTSIVPFQGDNGKPYRYLSIRTDVTALHELQEAACQSENKIQQARQILSQIIQGDPVATFVINVDHEVTHWNKGCEAVTGYSAAEIVGTHNQWRPFYAKKRPVMADLIVDQAMESYFAEYYHNNLRRSTIIEEAFEAEDFFETCGEKGRWLFFTAAPLRDVDGEIIGAIETLQDITERKIAEEALLRTSIELELLVEKRTQQLLNANTMLGEDVHRRKATEGALLRSEAALKDAQKLAHLGSWELDLVTGALAWSDECSHIFEFDPSRREIGFDTFASVIHPDDIDLAKRAYATSLNERRAYHLEFRLLFGDGRVKWVHEHCTTIFDATGKPIRSIGTTQDVSERKQAEEELRKSNDELAAANRQLHDTQNLLLQSDKMASVGQLAAGVAHEINNPIGYVNSNLGTLDRYLKDLIELVSIYEEMEKAVADDAVLAQVSALKNKVDLGFMKTDVMSLMSESREGILRVKKIVQDLKDFSRGDSSDEWQRVNLHQGLDSTINVASNEIKYKADVKKEYGDIPDVECLPSQLNQVFMNLLVNAAQAIGEQGTITLRTGRQGDEVWVEVADTGKGIAPEHISRIFDPFFTTKPVGKGTGLGLSLSYGIVQKHHGRIEVNSELNKGTSFKVWLPVHQLYDKSQTV